MTITYDLLASNVVGTATSSVTFSSISGSYRDLVVVCRFTQVNNTNFNFRLNGVTSNSYNQNSIWNTSAWNPGGVQGLFYGTTVINPTLDTLVRINIIGANRTDKHKALIWRSDEATNNTELHYGRFANTSSVDSITLFPSAGNINVGSTFYLYGIVS